MRALGLVAGGVMVVGLALPASAHHTDLRDPNDVRGKLDIREVQLAHREAPPVWTVVTFQKWRIREMWDRGYVLVFLDTMGTADPDYFALVRSDGERMRATLYRDRRKAADVAVRKLRTWRRGGRSVSVAVPLRFLEFGPHRTSHLWWAQTLKSGPACRRICIDRAPDDGAVEQPLG